MCIDVGARVSVQQHCSQQPLLLSCRSELLLKQEELAVLMEEQPVLLKLVQQMVLLLKKAKDLEVEAAFQHVPGPQAGTSACQFLGD